MLPRVLFLLLLGVVLIHPWAPATTQGVPSTPTVNGDDRDQALPPGAVARFGDLTMRHSADSLRGAVVTPDRRFVAAIGDGEDEVRIWNIETSKEERSLPAKGLKATFVGSVLALSSDGKMLAGALWKGPATTLVLWDFASGKELQQLTGMNELPLAVAFGDGGKTVVAVGHRGIVYRWDVQSGKAQKPWDAAATSVGADKNRPHIAASALSPDGSTLALNVLRDKSQGYLVLVWDLKTDKELWRTEPVQTPWMGLAFTADSRTLAYGLEQNTLCLCESDTGKIRQQLGVSVSSGLASIAIAGDGKTLVVVPNSDIRASSEIWDLTTGKLRGVLKLERVIDHLNKKRVVFVDDRRLLITNGGLLQIWDTVSNKLLTGSGHGEYVSHVLFSGDGKSLMIGLGKDWRFPNHLITLATASWKETARNTVRASPSSTVFSIDHSLVFSRDLAGMELRSRADKKTLWSVPGPQGISRGDCFSTDGSLLVVEDGRTGAGKTWRVIDTASGKILGHLPDDPRLPAKRPPLLQVWFSANRQLAWFAGDGRIAVVSVHEEVTSSYLGVAAKESILFGKGALAWSTDSRHLAACRVDATQIEVWNIGRSQVSQRIAIKDLTAGGQKATGAQDIYADRRPVTCLSFSPDDRMLAVGLGGSNEIVLVELASGQVRKRFAGHQWTVTSLSFAPNQRWLASGSADTTVLIWGLVEPTQRQP
jgi:WD40 repeat protein